MDKYKNLPSNNPHTYIHKDQTQSTIPLTQDTQGQDSVSTSTLSSALSQCTGPEPTTRLAEPPRLLVFPTVDMSHWSPNTDLGVSLQRAIYISLWICQPVSAPVSLSLSLSLPLPLWSCQSLFAALSLSLSLYLAFCLFDFSVAPSLLFCRFPARSPRLVCFSPPSQKLYCVAPQTQGSGWEWLEFCLFQFRPTRIH